MSLTGTSEDYWSTTTRCTIRERCKFMFNNELLSDVTFQVVARDAEGGSKSMKKIPAHKFLLAISSPVFYAMFCITRKHLVSPYISEVKHRLTYPRLKLEQVWHCPF